MHPFLVGHLEGATSEDSEPDETPTVSVVRSSPQAKAELQKSNYLLDPRVELGAFAVGTAVLVYFARHTNIALPAFGHHLKHSAGGGGFLEGFLLASVTASVIGIASALYLSKFFNLEVDFSKLPAHKASKNAIASADYPTGVLAPSTYQKFALRDKVELSEGIFRFVFNLPKSTAVLGVPIGQHVAIRGSVDDHSVTRSYTPISNTRDLGRLELIIRIYPDGQLGNYLKKLQPGDQVDIRGPKGAMKYRKGMSKELGLVGGGTGITPLFQIAVCEDKTDNTKLSLLYANRSEADIMLRKKLDAFAAASNGQFEIYYMLDKPPNGWQYGTGHIDKEVFAQKMPAVSEHSKVLLRGPPGLVNATKNNLVEPGSVSKMSDQILCF